MPVKMEPTSVIKARLGIEPNGPTHAFFTDTCAKAMDKYVPWDTGALAETVVIGGEINRANVTTNTITYDQDYASVVYYGVRNGQQLNYQTDTHELAGPYWDKRMWTAQGQDIVRQVQKYVDTHGGK